MTWQLKEPVRVILFNNNEFHRFLPRICSPRHIVMELQSENMSVMKEHCSNIIHGV